ncbi:peptide ABC transporter substrate-binding protein [Halioglobus maricola]|uniref:Peptide ABC transporter substrate-binding protein n=1 Tax=Halioglobus maricola TaxID=2601894 RepID=A0A5P9NNI3_9GAMM|nr:peptide ABC transporter substrate-binding protein [Halioglobus maricola]QFU77390.1 peptide ABC transporter substrate-binding protein [Halioglobus maricola]
MSKLRALWATVCLTAPLLTACGPVDSNVAHGNREGVLHINNGSEPQTIDPHIISSVPGGQIAWALFEGLVTLDPGTLEPMPGVAERWEISEDQLVWTFYLRDNARWSNGDPLTAEDFHWSFLRALSPAIGSSFAEYLFPIQGAREYFAGELDDPADLGVQVIDSHTLELTLHQPTPYFFQSLATFSSSMPVHRATIEAHGEPFARYTGWTRPENIVSNGPFVLSEWRMQKRLVVSKNPLYWDQQNVALEQIVFHPIDSESTEDRMYRVGQLHKTDMVPLAKIPEFLQSGNPEYRQTPMFGTYFLILNVERAPLDQVKVRQALAATIDRELLARSVLHDSVLPHRGIVPRGIAGYDPELPLPYDPEEGRRLLAEAGYPDGDGFPELEFIFNTSENNRKILIALQQMWKNELGISVTLTNMEWRVFVDKLDERDFQGSRLGWIGGFVDPVMFLELMTSDNVSNYSGFSNEVYDEIMRVLVPEAETPRERLKLLEEAEVLALKQAPYIPLYTYTDRYMIRQNVKGFPANLIKYYNYKYVSLADPMEQK